MAAEIAKNCDSLVMSSSNAKLAGNAASKQASMRYRPSPVYISGFNVSEGASASISPSFQESSDVNTVGNSSYQLFPSGSVGGSYQRGASAVAVPVNRDSASREVASSVRQVSMLSEQISRSRPFSLQGITAGFKRLSWKQQPVSDSPISSRSAKGTAARRKAETGSGPEAAAAAGFLSNMFVRLSSKLTSRHHSSTSAASAAAAAAPTADGGAILLQPMAPLWRPGIDYDAESQPGMSRGPSVQTAAASHQRQSFASIESAAATQDPFARDSRDAYFSRDSKRSPSPGLPSTPLGASPARPSTPLGGAASIPEGDEEDPGAVGSTWSPDLWQKGELSFNPSFVMPEATGGEYRKVSLTPPPERAWQYKEL